jgi:sugar lactone lactonase YvrE
VNKIESTVLVDDYDYLEGARWHRGRLWVSEMHRGDVLSFDELGGVRTEATMPRPSGLGWLPDGRLLAASYEDAHLYVQKYSGVGPHVDLGEGGKFSLNDMIVAPSGVAYCDRYYVPDAHATEDDAELPPGQIVAVLPDGTVRVVAEDVLFPNGLAITADKATLLVSLTAGQGVEAFDIADDGSLANRRMWAELPGKTPDGICLDAEGAAWVASFQSGEFLRVLEGGTVTDVVETGTRWAVQPCLGGSDGKTLFMLTADTDIDRFFAKDYSARVEVARVSVPAGGYA